VLHAEKAHAQTGTFGFYRPTSQNAKNQKSLFFANARTEKMKFETDKKNLK